MRERMRKTRPIPVPGSAAIKYWLIDWQIGRWIEIVIDALVDR